MKISIIIPIYNVEPYIENCLKSVLSQSYHQMEVILIDDCGNDNSMKIATEVINQYTGTIEIKIIHHSKNSGLSAARNTGINASTGEFLFFLDSDDTLPPNAINELVQQAQKYNKIDFVIGGIKATGYSNYEYKLLSKEYIDNNHEILFEFLNHRWNVMACNKLIRKDFIMKKNICFWEGVYHEDMDFSFKIALNAERMACCYNITYNYLTRQDSITNQKKEKNYNDFIIILQNNINLLLEKKLDSSINDTIIKYCINSIFYSIFDLIKEKSIFIDNHFKKSCIINLQNFYKEKINYFQNLPTQLKIKEIYILSPFILQYSINYLYRLIKK